MDVEGILNQIRERVVTEHTAGSDDARLSTAVHSNGSAAVGNRDEALQRLRTHLAIANRAADRLPPVFSNRQGARARFELWIKNKSKPLTRWFTWEQVNFNRAVNDALCDVVEVLKGEAQELAALRGQLTALQSQLSQEIQQQFSAARVEAREQIAEASERIAQLQSSQARFHSEIEGRWQKSKEAIANLTTEAERRDTELANNSSRLEAEHANLTVAYELLSAEHKSLTAEHAKLADQVIELAAQLRAEDLEIKSEQNKEINRRLSQLAEELKEEQRVCFRQISLEAGESAVLEDRARRALLSRLEQLEEALKTGQR